MFVMTRLRTAAAQGDRGAVAVVVAITALTLFGTAALAIDIGEMYSRRRAAQTDADLAALAGVTALPGDQTAARQRAYDYLVKNLPSGGGPGPITDYADGNLGNGEILFPTATKIRVVIPPRLVKFGFAGAIGFNSSTVNAAATAEVRSPQAALPFFVTIAGATGYSCLKDTSGGQTSPSALRAALLPDAGPKPQVTSVTSPLSTLGSTQMVIGGNKFTGPNVTSVTIDGASVAFVIDNGNQITVASTPAHAAGVVAVVVTTVNGSDTGSTTYVPPPTITSTSPPTLSTAGGDVLTIAGTDFDSPAPSVTSVRIDGSAVGFSLDSATQITVPAASAHAAGSATLTVTNSFGTATTTLSYATPPPTAPPTVTAISPTSGPSTGGTVVTITGTGFTTATGVTFGSVAAVNPTITDDTTIQATAPAGTGAVHVHVTNPGGTSAETDADLFTYEVDACAGTTGSYGYLHVGRSQPPTASGANDLVMINSIVGIDHGWTTFPPSQLPQIPGTECLTGSTLIPGAILDNGNGVEGANCVDIENGNKTNDVATAFLDGYTKSDPDLPARLADPGGSHTTGTIHGRDDLDIDHISDYLTVPLADFTNELKPGGTVTPGWISTDILTCPRFAIVPVLNVDNNPPNGFYPIKAFAGVFIDSPADEYGFEPNNNGNQMKTIKAYAFSLDFLPGIISNGTVEGTVTFVGSGPKVPVLVHDTGDPSY